jgi:anti-anti-sigma factor
MDITVSLEQGRVPVTVLRITGNIDASNFEQLNQVSLEAINRGARYIVIDLTKVLYVSSAALRTINNIFQQLNSINKNEDNIQMQDGISAGTYKSPYLKLLNPSKNVIDVLKVTGFDMFLDIHKDFKMVIDSF